MVLRLLLDHLWSLELQSLLTSEAFKVDCFRRFGLDIAHWKDLEVELLRLLLVFDGNLVSWVSKNAALETESSIIGFDFDVDGPVREALC